MPKKELTDDYIVSDHGNWNVAADYSRLKIMKHLYFADEYETIATFGFVDFEEELTYSGNADFLKIRGFKRLIKTLLMIISNSRFAIKEPERKTINGYAKELIKYGKVLNLLYKYRRNQQKKTKELVIIPEKYDKALDRVIEIKTLINEPLNRYDLIFTHKEEFDPKKYKKGIKEGLTEVG